MFEPAYDQGLSPSAARLRRASFALLVAGSGLLLAVAGAMFVWWFAIGTYGF